MDRMCETCEAALDAGLHSIGHEGASDGELRAALNGEHPPVEEHTCVDDYIRIGDHRLDANSWAALLDVSEPTGCECSHCHGYDNEESDAPDERGPTQAEIVEQYYDDLHNDETAFDQDAWYEEGERLAAVTYWFCTVPTPAELLLHYQRQRNYVIT